MMTISYKTIKRILLIFTAVPVMIFFIGWLTPAAAVHLCIGHKVHTGALARKGGGKEP